MSNGCKSLIALPVFMPDHSTWKMVCVFIVCFVFRMITLSIRVCAVKNMKKEKIERALRLQERAELRKKNTGEYFVNFSKHLRPWLHELAKTYKASGEFPLMPKVLLQSYYEDQRDKEVAVFAGLLFAEDGENVVERVSEFRKMLGESPWEWFANRRFFRLSLGRNQNLRTGGVMNWKIARLFDKLWQEHFDKTTKPTSSIGQTIKLIADIQHCSYFDVLTYLLTDCCVGNYEYKLRLLLQILACSDGFSLGLWSVAPSELKCPLAGGLRQFLQTWFPDYRAFGNVDDAIRLFGFEVDCDFLYAYLGYKELQKRNPKGCSELATAYLRWYEGGIKKKPYQWREILPEIPQK